MCARYGIEFSESKITLTIGGKTVSLHFRSVVRPEIFPTNRVEVVRIIGSVADVAELHWGFLPKWMKPGRPVINARDDKLHSSSLWKDALETRRCLIPASSFFEWQSTPGRKRKIKMKIHLLDQVVFFFAGLWGTFQDKDGEPMDCCAIITTTPNETMRPIHNRMPAILDETDRGRWLAGEALNELIRPYSGPMRAEPSDSETTPSRERTDLESPDLPFW